MSIKLNIKTSREISNETKEKNSRFFDKKFLPLKFIRETLAIDDDKGKVDKEIIHTSIVKSAIKNTLSR